MKKSYTVSFSEEELETLVTGLGGIWVENDGLTRLYLRLVRMLEDGED